MPHTTSDNRQSNHRTTETQKSSQDERFADLTAAYQASLDFQSTNQDAISKTSTRFASSVEAKAIEEKVKDFASSSQVLMDVLDDIRKIHPVIDVAVLAFKAVVTLELKRRDNDQKVLVLQVKMQDMMEIFVQLRVIAPDQKESNRGFTVAESLEKLCSRIADDIWSCANLCDSYSKKRILVKLLKSPIYEGRLAGYVEAFVERRAELHTVLGMFTSHKIHSTFSLLESNQDILKSINDMIQVIFERLRTQTPIEQQIWKLIESKGGLEKCTQDDSALTELVKFDLYGPVPSNEAEANVSTIPATVYPGYTTFSSQGTVIGLTPTPSIYQPPMSQARTSTLSQAPTTVPVSEMYRGPSAWSEVPVQTASFPRGSNVRRSPSYAIHKNRSASRDRRYSRPSVRFDRPESPSHHQPTTVFSTRPSQYGAGYAPASYGYSDTAERERSTTARRTESGHASEAPYYGSGYGYGSALPEDPESRRNKEQDQPDPSPSIVNDLKEELQVDVDDDLKKNMQVFKRKLDEQLRQLKQIEDTVIHQGDRVISVVREGPHDRVHDPELRAIWKEMGWKLGVPVQEFVHTLHDYYVAQNSDTTVLDDHFRIPPSPGSTADDQTLALRAAFSAAKQRASEKWALKHINIKNIVPLMEVFDGDASGFVSVWEANQVASLRPDGWSFLQWLAYWAAGRHFTIWQYRQKIGAIILQMHKSLDDMLPTNRDVVNHYLYSLWTVDQVLCQIIPCTEAPDGMLAEKIASYTHTEETIMEQKLKALNHEIDGPDTLGLIIGNSQIERNLLPLIYLLLKHHLKVIRAGSRIVFDCEEFTTAEETLYQIFDAIYARVETLYWLFGAAISDIPVVLETRLEKFAFGMYSAVFRGNDPYYPVYLDYGITKEVTKEITDWEQSDSSNLDASLKHSSPEIVDPADTSFHPFNMRDYIAGVEGFWTGYLYDMESIRTTHGMMEFRVYTWNFSDESFAAKGSYSNGMLSIHGSIKIHGQQGTLNARLIANPDYEKDPKHDISLWGKLDIVRDFSVKGSIARSLPPQYTFSGNWSYSSNQVQSRANGTFYFSQTPPWVHQFRMLKLPQTSDLNNGRSSNPRTLNNARLRWKFALNAVLHQVYSQKGLFRMETVRDMLTRLRRAVELARYQYLLPHNQPMSIRDEEELNRLLIISAPWTSRFCRSIARCGFPSMWGALHFYSLCTICRGVILGNRYYCLTCADGLHIEGEAPSCDYCSTCRHDHDKERPGHSLMRMKAFNHNRDTYPLSDRVYSLRYRPTPITPVIIQPPSPPAEISDSRDTWERDWDDSQLEDEEDGDKLHATRSRRDSDAISKRVRFSLNAFRSSSSAPSSAIEHNDSAQSTFKRHRRVSFPASTSGTGLRGLGLLGMSRSPRLGDIPSRANSIASIPDSDLGEGERGSVDVSNYRDKPTIIPANYFAGVKESEPLQCRCVSCNRAVHLMQEIYWNCIICSEPKTGTFIVMCTKCELQDRGLLQPSMSSDVPLETKRQLENFNDHDDTVGTINSDIAEVARNTVKINEKDHDHQHPDTRTRSHDQSSSTSDKAPSHRVDHPLVRVFEPRTSPPLVMLNKPARERLQRRQRYESFDSIASRDIPTNASSKRRMALNFVKGMFAGSGSRKAHAIEPPLSVAWVPSPRTSVEGSEGLGGKSDSSGFEYLII